MDNLLKDSFIYTIGRVLPQIISFVLLPVYTFYLSTSDFGIFNSMQVISSIMGLIFTLALDRGVLRLYYSFKSDYDKKEYLSTMSYSIYIFSSFILLFVFLFSDSVNLIFESIRFYPYYSYAIISSYFQVYSLIPLIYLQINKKPKTYIFLTFLNFLIGTIITIYLVIFKDQGALGMIKGLFFSSIIILPFYLYISFKIFVFSFNLKNLKLTLDFSLPMIPTLISAWIFNFSDRIFIEKYFNLNDVAIYSLGAKISSVILILFSAFSTAYSPYFYELANSKNASDVKSKISLYNHLIIKIFSFFILVILIFSEEIIELFFKSEYLNSIPVIEILTASTMISVLLGLLNLMYYQSKATLKLMYIFIFSSIVNIILNFILIPKFSYIGASYATFLTLFIMLLIQLKLSKNVFYVSFNWNDLFKLLFSSIFIYLISKFLINFNIIYNLILKSIIISLIIIFLFKDYFYLKFKLLK